MQLPGFWLSFFVLFNQAQGVSIQLKHWYTDHTVVTHSCTDIDPGVCCRPYPSATGSTNSIAGSEIIVYDLRFQQVAFGYGRPHPPVAPSLPSEDCTGTPLARFAGPKRVWREYQPKGPDWQGFYVAAGFFPPDWHPAIPATWGTHAPPVLDMDAPWPSDPDHSILGASWVDLRTRFPPESDARVRYLQWQGVQGLVWGKDVWSAASDGVIFPRGEYGRLAKRLILPNNVTILTNALTKGTAYLTRPKRWTYAERVNETMRSGGR